MESYETQPILPHEPAMPAIHDGWATAVLSWPSIRRMVEPLLQGAYKATLNFPLKEELRHVQHYSTVLPARSISPNSAQIRLYVSSFCSHLLCIYPIFTVRDLDGMVKRFQTDTGSRTDRTATSSWRLAPPRTINTAIVLLVLALGRICLHRDEHSMCSDAFRQDDRVPGHDYFALASQILGNQIGGMALPHVHAHVLAGLFYDQIGRVFESALHITTAGSVLQIIMGP